MSSSTGGIENGVWYIDWTTNYNPLEIPKGVTTINLFEGKLDIVNGKYTIDGLNAQRMGKLQAFIDQCHQQGIQVKISLGGAGGQKIYNDTWDQLMGADGKPDQQKIEDFASGMAEFCHTYGIDGIDFDYEEWKSAAQETAVGQLIRQYKEDGMGQYGKNFATSVCTNAGFGPNFPWQEALTNIFNAAKLPDGSSSVDRLYIMSYTNSLQDEEKWIGGWANWAKTNYGLDPNQIDVGIDPTSGAYDYNVFAKWAHENGYSSCMWDWDPANSRGSNGYSEAIRNDFHPKQNPQ